MKFILFILLSTNTNAFNDIDLVEKTKNIAKASKNYFQDIYSWPANIEILINTNYLQNDNYQQFSLLKNFKNLNIIINNISNDSTLSQYLIDGIWSDDNFIWTINAPNNLFKKINNGLFCSNLFCQQNK